jgi:hypothetical protein
MRNNAKLNSKGKFCPKSNIPGIDKILGPVTLVEVRGQTKPAEDGASFVHVLQELKALEALLKFSKNRDSRAGTKMRKANGHSDR